jgi:phage shock protein A
MQETLGTVSDTSSFEAFERLASKVDQMEVEVEALNEMEMSLSDSNLAARFKELEQSVQNEDADRFLAELKRKLLEEKN